jgi:hypothetical protein
MAEHVGMRFDTQVGRDGHDGRDGDRPVDGSDCARQHRNAAQHGTRGRANRGQRHYRGRRRHVLAQAETVDAGVGPGVRKSEWSSHRQP